MTDAARCEPPEEWRDGVTRAIHDGMGDGWAFTNYAGDEWRTNRDMLNAAAVSVWKHLSPVLTPAEAAALRAERDEAVGALEGIAKSAAEDLRQRNAALDEAETLRANNARLREALEWSHAAFVAQRDQAPVRKRLMALTIKNCRMAVVDIIVQARAALAQEDKA